MLLRSNNKGQNWIFRRKGVQRVEFSHVSVMLAECLSALNIRQDGIYLDGTAGGAGHSVEIAKNLKNGHLWALDQDPAAVETAKQRLAGLPATVLHGNFRQAKRALVEHDIESLDGALLDLGVSSHQLDSAKRGFSYRATAALDMRMSQEGPMAADLLQTLERQEIADLLRRYGEEPYAWQIAGKIVQTREEKPIETTTQLAELVASAVPSAVRRKDKNPARRTFQALRIAVNRELEALEEGLGDIFEMLRPGGRFVILTFHSLEDRIVKHRFRDWTIACTCPPKFPVCVCGGKARGKLVGKNPTVASEQEQEENRRSRSAKLRVIEKL